MTTAPDQRRRIVITGIGPVTPIGIGREAFWKNLHEGHSGVGPIVGYRGSAARGNVGGEVADFTEDTAKKEFPKTQRKNIKVMCREIQMGATAALLALGDSKLDMAALDHERMGVEYGANLMFFTPDGLADPCAACFDESRDFDFSKWGEKGLGAMEPLWMLKYLPNMPACHIAIFTDARGPNNSVTVDEASPGVALTEALNILERRAADVMITGGTGTRLHPTKALHARLWEDLAYDEANPSASCKPFDVHRSGQVVAEGATALILEDEEHAKARGATIYGRILGGGTSCVASPDGKANIRQAIANAFSAALRRSGHSPSELGHINASGLATQVDDAVEAEAIRAVLGESARQIPVTGLKGFFGNPGAAGGFAELAGSLLALRDGYIPQTLNCTEPDPALGLDIVTTPRPTTNKLFAKISYTRRGQASAVIVESL